MERTTRLKDMNAAADFVPWGESETPPPYSPSAQKQWLRPWRSRIEAHFPKVGALSGFPNLTAQNRMACPEWFCREGFRNGRGQKINSYYSLRLFWRFLHYRLEATEDCGLRLKEFYLPASGADLCIKTTAVRVKQRKGSPSLSLSLGLKKREMFLTSLCRVSMKSDKKNETKTFNCKWLKNESECRLFCSKKNKKGFFFHTASMCGILNK